MLKIISKPIRKILNNFGYEIIKKTDAYIQTESGNWLEKLNISTIIDVGANIGQFSLAINATLPGRKIIAFEPIKSCYDKLVENTKSLDITTFNCGLSDEDSTSEINISENFESSSFLQMESLHKKLYPYSKYTGTQEVQIKRMDDVLGQLKLANNVLLKIDVQGYERHVLAGGTETLKSVSAVIIEFAYQPIYSGQWLFDETYSFFNSIGFAFVGFADQVYSKETAIPIYGDAIFVKRELVKSLY